MYVCIYNCMRVGTVEVAVESKLLVQQLHHIVPLVVVERHLRGQHLHPSGGQGLGGPFYHYHRDIDGSYYAHIHHVQRHVCMFL